MERRLLTFIGLGILGLGAIALRETVLSRPSSAPPPADAHVVRIRPEGFIPETIEIRAGETVVWVNEDRALHWPASDPHPTHTGLPRFDALGELREGESWNFTFREPGTFPYHDHAAARTGAADFLRAAVIVRP